MKYDVRLKLVHYAAEHGVKPGARAFEQVQIDTKYLNAHLDRLGDRVSGRALQLGTSVSSESVIRRNQADEVERRANASVTDDDFPEGLKQRF